MTAVIAINDTTVLNGNSGTPVVGKEATTTPFDPSVISSVVIEQLDDVVTVVVVVTAGQLEPVFPVSWIVGLVLQSLRELQMSTVYPKELIVVVAVVCFKQPRPIGAKKVDDGSSITS